MAAETPECAGPPPGRWAGGWKTRDNHVIRGGVPGPPLGTPPTPTPPHLPAPSVLYRKFQQDTKEETPQDVLYWGRLMQYLSRRRSSAGRRHQETAFC